MAGKHSGNNEGTKEVRTKKTNNNKSKTKKKRRGLKIFLVTLLVILIIALGVIVGGYSFIMNKLGKMQQVDINVEELDVNEELKGYRNIALFGVDSRTSNLGKGNRSDCIIIASINDETKDVKLISVYRDTYLEIEGHGLDKVTHAYSYGEAPLAIKTLNTNLDLNIKEFATVNFDVLAEAIDALGGIQLDISTTEVKYMNQYMDETAKAAKETPKYVSSPGTQTLNGVQAVAFSRIRYTEGGDYKRTERMRTVLEAMLKKLKTKSVGEINKLMDRVLPKVYTNISAGNIIAMIPDLPKYNIKESIGWPYKTQGITLDRWYGVPVTLESNVKQLHLEAFGETDYVVPDNIKEISNKIIAKTGYKGQ